MNAEVVKFYAQKKFAEEYIQSCKYAIGKSECELFHDSSMQGACALWTLLALFYVLPDSAC